MRTKLLCALVGFCFSSVLTSQIKIGDNPQNINANSVLELESSSRVLVISRMSEQQMNSITPLAGAMVYNNDAGCVFYYTGSAWVNLCDSLQLQFTTDPIVNPIETIVITENGDTVNFEVGQIEGANIVDFSINSDDIQNNSIDSDKLAPDSVGSEELQDNTITDAEIDYNLVTLADFFNDAGYITSADIISGDTGNDLIAGTDNGVFFDSEALELAIQANTNAIAADADTNVGNELQDLSIVGDQLSITGGNTVTIPTADGSDTVIQAGTDIDVQGSGTGVDPYIITNTFTEADGSTLNEIQNINEVLNDGNNAGGLQIKNIGTPTDPADAATKAYVDASAGGGGDPTDELITSGQVIGTDLVINEGNPNNQTIIDVSDLISNGSETIINDSPTVTVAGTGTALDPYLLTSTGGADGSETIINDSPTVTVAGTGTALDPYLLTSTGGADGSETIINDSPTVTVAGTGTALDPYLLTSTGGADGSETIINDSPTVTVAGTGTTLDPYVLTSTGGADGSETIINDSPTVTVTGAGTTLDPYVLNSPDTSDGSETIVTGSASVGVAGMGTLTDPYVLTSMPSVQSGATLVGNGTFANPLDVADDGITTIKILDNNVTPAKIAEGTNGQVLTTDAAGDVIWADPVSGAVTTGTTIDGDGSAGAPLELADDAVTTVKILDNNVTPAKIAEGTDGQVLTTDAAGDVIWADPVSGAVTTATTIDGDGSVGAPLDLADDAVTTVKILDDNVTPAKIAEGTDGQVLTTDAAGDVIWADPTGGTVSTGTTIDGDGSAGTPLELADDAVTTIKILDDNVTPAKIEEGTNGQVLTTDVSGDVIWADPSGGVIGTTGGIFFADDVTGAATEVSTSLKWDITKRFGTGQLQVGLDGGPENNIAKVHIMEDRDGLVAHPIMIQNESGDGVTGSAVGILFAVDELNSFGKGSLVYERTLPTPGFARGDFHFLQNQVADFSEPDLGDAVMTIQNNGEVGIGITDPTSLLHVNGDLRVINEFRDTDGDAGTAGQVLSSTGTGTNWVAAGGGGAPPTDTDTDDGLTDYSATVGYDINVDDTTIEINADALQVKDDGITSAKINDGTIVAADLNQMGATDGQVLQWVDASTAWVPTTPSGAITGTTGGVFFADNAGVPTDDTTQLFWDATNERLGIGTNTPSDKLQVVGTVRSQGYLTINGGAGVPAYTFDNNTFTGMYLQDGAGVLAFSTNAIEAMRINTSQDMGVGIDPVEKLHVDGNIRAEGAFISATGTILPPDFVFETYFNGSSKLDENYRFLPLEKVEAFVRTNKHLPGIRSAYDIMESGQWDLTESSFNNLEKIEELFLHTIAQEKKIKKLESENTALAKELEAIKGDLEVIKSLLKERK
ncbi:beta strand repeat-containing protein [Poritiphilus flavus]|uniref:Uncharacterized protein n=1 Tax=Poritiphilus flavus TaxID=2697053 RepID=A0A6L9EIW7_9FLAO|nr:hypothetical protein [Poritiphilus flavus]NAS14119.1 hypothetical protein [Poritiphilus flavus]